MIFGESFNHCFEEMSGKPKILILENSVDVTGALKSITRAANDLKQFYEFHFLIPVNSRGATWCQKNGFNNIAEFPFRELNRTLISILVYLPALIRNAIYLKRIVKDKKIDLIHGNDLYNLLPAVVRIFGVRTPYICHIRFRQNQFPSFLFNFWLSVHFKYAEKIIVVSETLKAELPDHPKIIRIHNELPVEEKYHRFENAQQKTSFRFLYLANFIQGKGQDYALMAFHAIHTQIPDWKLHFVGGDMGLKKNQIFLQELVATAVRMGISEKISWSGFTDDVEKEYKDADIVLNFSESESFSITCLEALFYGRPLIASNSGGPAEIIDHNKSGLLVTNRETDEMAESMVRLALDRNFRDDLAANARASVREKFSIEKTSFRMKRVYDHILNRVK